MSVTHLGQYWSAKHREVRLLVTPGEFDDDGRPSGRGWDITDAVDLARHRRRYREAGGFRSDGDGIPWTYSGLPFPTVELVERVERDRAHLADWAAGFDPRLAAGAVELDLLALDLEPDAERDHLVAPILPRRAQAFGVTYLNSALEREEEGKRADYGYVYRSVKDRGERPELFIKGTAPEHFVGPRGRMGLRRDQTNSLDFHGKRTPRESVAAGIEPELAACVHSDGSIWGYTLADDVSGNRIENETLLYLYQAKHFTGALVLGPLVEISREQRNPRVEIRTRILAADGGVLFERATNSARINAPLGDLIAWAGSHIRLTPGEVFSTGTDCVPDGSVKVLDETMRVEIFSPTIGRLQHGAAWVPPDQRLNLDYSRLELQGAER